MPGKIIAGKNRSESNLLSEKTYENFLIFHLDTQLPVSCRSLMEKVSRFFLCLKEIITSKFTEQKLPSNITCLFPIFLKPFKRLQSPKLSLQTHHFYSRLKSYFVTYKATAFHN